MNHDSIKNVDIWDKVGVASIEEVWEMRLRWLRHVRGDIHMPNVEV